ncbi:MAG: FMN-binding glutamate synthase family protein [Flavobacteriales bacterium]
MRRVFIIVSVFLLFALGSLGAFHSMGWWIALAILSPLYIIGYLDLFQKEHTIRRNFPLIGNLRYLFEDIRPEIYQYFIESDTDGRPFNRKQRSIVYQRAKKELQTVPFGSQYDDERIGHEWIDHSIYPTVWEDKDPRITVGGSACKKPYEASILNISAMSFGALGKNAITALNAGARIGGFAHNTGEGGVSPYHYEGKGDLIWQIGTGYFGCRSPKGAFDPDAFEATAQVEQIRMIEIKISQGAKPAHGGVLPAEKNTEEIAHARGVEPFQEVVSPPAHSMFEDEHGLLDFIAQLRELAGGKPVGFKLCMGEREEFLQICRAMLEKGVYPDFITIDDSNGGTGAAPLEFSDSIGMPLKNGLSFAHDALQSCELRHHIRLFASGRIINGFDMIRTMALGADACYSARGMMFALGCIQALRCNQNNCPTGVATHNPQLQNGLLIEDKKKRVARFHDQTVRSAVEILQACGMNSFSDLKRKDINRRGDNNRILTYEELYPYQKVSVN